jgi:hypothetical protein
VPTTTRSNGGLAISSSAVDLSPELVRALVVRLFAPADQSSALALLESYGTAPYEREPVRVRVAALKLSSGRLEDLEQAISTAKRDYRDVLAAAEYPEEGRRSAWKLSPAELDRVRAADRTQYLAWLAAQLDRTAG